MSLECCIRSIAPRALPHQDGTLNHLLHQCFAAVDAAKLCLHDSDSLRQLYNALVYCQSLVLLAIACDRPVGAGSVGSTTQLLGQLSGAITDAGLNDSRTLNMLRELDTDAYLGARRVFWTSFILDRFYASSRSKDMMLPFHAGSVLRDDHQALCGDVGYHLARKHLINSLGQNLTGCRRFRDRRPNHSGDSSW